MTADAKTAKEAEIEAKNKALTEENKPELDPLEYGLPEEFVAKQLVYDKCLVDCPFGYTLGQGDYEPSFNDTFYECLSCDPQCLDCEEFTS